MDEYVVDVVSIKVRAQSEAEAISEALRMINETPEFYLEPVAEDMIASFPEEEN